MDVVLVPDSALPPAPAIAWRPHPQAETKARPSIPEQPAAERQDSPRLPTGKDTARLEQAPAPKRKTAPELVEATTLYTASVLASRLGKATLRDLDLTDPQERVIQLCNHEAIEQVRRKRPKLRARFALAEARSAPALSGLSVTADGAAIHGAGRWYDLSFRCEVTPDLAGVASFAFALGPEISRSDRTRLDLPAEDDFD